ncbi:hypothetical protein JNB11_06900 [Kocuria palustris]|nr:hypothetical protein [Kocuria palustris]
MGENDKLVTWDHLISYYNMLELQLAAFNLDHHQLSQWKAVESTHEFRHKVGIVDHHDQPLLNLSDIISEPNPLFSMSSSIVALSPVANHTRALAYYPMALSPRADADTVSLPQDTVIPLGDDIVADL